MNSYKELKVYSLSIDFVLELYKVAETFPTDEKFGLVSQLKRAAVSIPSNIAEGAQRQTKAEFVKFLFFAFGSCAEVETQLLLASKLNMISTDVHQELTEKLTIISKMIRKLILSLKQKDTLEKI